MNITTNGKARIIADGATITELLESLNLAAERVVIEHNGKALPRDRFAHTKLASGDRLEIAQMVGGG